MGQTDFQEVESQSKVINDPVISEYVNRVGENIVRNSDSQVPFSRIGLRNIALRTLITVLPE